MVVKFFLILGLSSLLFGDIYEQNCLACHRDMPVQIDKFFYRYLLKYSSEERVKSALVEYLKNPSLEKTILQEGLLNRFGIKEKTTLNDAQLKTAVDTYWQTYKVFGKLR